MSGFENIMAALEAKTNEAGLTAFLSSLHWPLGLQHEVLQSLKSIPIRFFIFDDSGSMSTPDGHKLVPDKQNNIKIVRCSRWAELSQSLKFHIDLSRAASAPSEIRTLNGAPQLLIGTEDDYEDENRDKLGKFFSNGPSGQTPLCRHIKDVIHKVKLIAPELESKGQKACVIIITDGEASDGDLLETMKPLNDLPVLMVVKLCTDEQRVVDYWNSIDQQLEVSIDILDDFVSESIEVAKVNNWLSYGPPLHLLREFGTSCRDFDMIDETPCTGDQIKNLCWKIYGGTPDSYPDPHADWDDFAAVIAARNENPELFPISVKDPNENPIRKRPWVDIAEVAKVLGN